jgi:hypothetical protein
MATVDTLMTGHFPSWAYCDPFLRFLRTVGPTGASLLNSVCIQGFVRPHESGDPLVCDAQCGEHGCLNYHLQLYAPFVERHCPRLRKLRLGASAWRCEFRDFDRYLCAIVAAEMPKFRDLTVLVVETGEWGLNQEHEELVRKFAVVAQGWGGKGTPEDRGRRMNLLRKGCRPDPNELMSGCC